MSQHIPYNNGRLRNVHIFKLKPLKEDDISRNQENLLLIFWGPKLSRRENQFWDSLSISVPTIQNQCAFSWKQELQETAHFL